MEVWKKTLHRKGINFGGDFTIFGLKIGYPMGARSFKVYAFLEQSTETLLRAKNRAPNPREVVLSPMGKI